jgi:hypothetical protein
MEGMNKMFWAKVKATAKSNYGGMTYTDGYMRFKDMADFLKTKKMYESGGPGKFILKGKTSGKPKNAVSSGSSINGHVFYWITPTISARKIKR